MRPPFQLGTDLVQGTYYYIYQLIRPGGPHLVPSPYLASNIDCNVTKTEKKIPNRTDGRNGYILSG